MSGAEHASDAGRRVVQSDSRYDTLVAGFNLRWQGTPAYVELCSTADEVIAAVNEAIRADLRVTVRGGGHCYENFVSDNPGGVIIDLSPMGNVSLDGMGYCVEGGATLWNVYSHLYKNHGVTLPGGSCYSVGAGGHVTAGGYGLLSRLYGLTVDYLHAVEVVCVESATTPGVKPIARKVLVSADSKDEHARQLLWAHKGGGGGNFGIVTRFWFRGLPSAPNYAVIDSLAWNWKGLSLEVFRNLLTVYGEFFAKHEKNFLGLFTLLVLPQYANECSQIVLTMQEVPPKGGGELQGGIDELRKELTRTGVIDSATEPTGVVGSHPVGPVPANGQKLPWLYATQSLNGSGPNRRGKYKSAYMKRAFPKTQIEIMWHTLSQRLEKQTQSLVQIDSYGGHMNSVSSDATAVAQRSSIMKLQFQTYWTNPNDDLLHLGWIRKFYTDLYGVHGPVPDDTMDGCYVGYPDIDLTNWQKLYYGDNYAALKAVKDHWDPENHFRHAQSI